MLPEHRLTFSYGATASIVPKRGYEVHGVAMKWRTEEDWEKMKDPGYARVVVDIYPYDEPHKPIKAVVFVLAQFDDSKLDGPMEKLPQERYLRLIAQGMRKYDVDDDYINDQIMSVPYIPSRKAEDYVKFPVAQEPLPVVSFETYKRKCRRTRDLYFVVGDGVFRVGEHDPGNPVCVMLRSKAHGKDDITLATYHVMLDPDIPECHCQADLKPIHFAWAENQLMDMFEQAGLTATKVMIISDEVETRYCCFCFMRGASSSPEESSSGSCTGLPANDDVE